jgi:coproporphyrinogen III oxidase-like Fe-S oxidoreductase
MLGLRLVSGVHAQSFVRRFGRAVLDRRRRVMDELSDLGLLERDGPWIRVPRSSTLVANEALCRLL